MQGQPLIIRADASTEIGTGHLMRCLALAQAWKAQGGKAIFVTACESDALRQRLWDEGFEIVTLEHPYPHPDDWQRTSEILANYPGAWVVLDGYHFDSSYQLKIKQAGHPLLVIDDMAHLEHYYADIVLNQNIHAEKLRYSCEPYTRLLLGNRYVLLRSEYLVWRDWKREIPEVARKVLVTLSGSDSDNVTLKAIRALQQVDLEGLEAIVVVGASNPHYQELVQATRESKLKMRIVRNPTNMPKLMTWADVAISGGGTTCWELLFMGVPSLLLILADNQRLVTEWLDRIGVALNLGWHENASVSKIADSIKWFLGSSKIRREMSEHSRRLVDGEGINRVLIHIGRLNIRFRQADENDCRLVWEWANDPEVRAASFSSEPIPWEEHVQWFKSKISDSNCLFLIVMDGEGIPIGQVRFDVVRGNQEAVISVSIARKWRGKGYGNMIIRLASEKLFEIYEEIHVIQAYIKPNNKASIRAFKKAGYKEAGVTVIYGHEAVHLFFEKQEVRNK